MVCQVRGQDSWLIRAPDSRSEGCEFEFRNVGRTSPQILPSEEKAVIISMSCHENYHGCRPRGFTVTLWRCCATARAHSFYCSCVLFCLCVPFNCISFHKSSRQLSAFSLCSNGLISALLVLSTIYLFMKVSLNPDITLCGLLG